MSPARMATALPIPSAALAHLDKARSALPAARRHIAINAIVSAALSDGPDISSAATQYVLRRLVNGVSVSAGGSRSNFSATLMLLARALADANGERAVTDLVQFIKSVYGTTGSFAGGYVGAEREKALGTLASCAAVVRGGARSISTTAARDLLTLLRSTVDGECAKWRLGRAALETVSELLHNMDPKAVEKSLAKQLWQWCEERVKSEDGVELALLLRCDFKVIAKGPFEALYPTLSVFSDALMDTFESGYAVPRPQQDAAGSGHDALPVSLSFSDLPLAWSLAVRYVSTKDGTKHLGGLGVFWEKIVLSKLVEESSSGEKKALAIELLPLALLIMPDMECFERVFSEPLASAIVAAQGGAKGRGSSVVRFRRRKGGDDLAERLALTAKLVGSKLIDAIKESKSSSGNGNEWTRAIIVWSIHGRITQRLFNAGALNEILANLDNDQCSILFSDIVDTLAQPSGNFRFAGKIRGECVRILCTLGVACPKLAKDVANVIVLYSVFTTAKDSISTDAGGKFIRSHIPAYRKRALRTMYCGALPLANPAFSPDTAQLAFRRLISFITEIKEDVDGRDLKSSVITFLARVAKKSGDLGLQRRSKYGNTAETDAMREKIAPLMKLLSNKTTDPVDAAVIACLRAIAEYLALYLYDPAGNRETASAPSAAEQAPSDESEYLALFNQLSNCATAIFANKCVSSTKNSTQRSPVSTAEDDEEDDESPTALEQATHIITVLCGKESASFRHIAVIAAGMLSQVVDDSAIAVLFDAIESVSIGQHRDRGDAEYDEASMDGEIEDDDSESLDTDEDEQNQSKIDVRKEDGEGSDDDDGKEIDVDMDIDDEDPAVLAEYDRRLSEHMRLLQVSKKSSSAGQRKRREAWKATQVSRLFEVVEVFARSLRMRIEKHTAADVRTPIVFLDLLVRLHEYVYSADEDNVMFVSRVVAIVSKHLDRPASLFLGKVSDEDVMNELLERFFTALINVEKKRSTSTPESRMIAHTASLLTAISASTNANKSDVITEWYEKLWLKVIEPGHRFFSTSMFQSLAQRAPSAALSLTAVVSASITSEKATSGARHIAVQTLFSFTTAARTMAETEGAVRYWEFVTTIMNTTLQPEVTSKYWKHGLGLEDMIRVVSVGVELGRFPDPQATVLQVENACEALTVPRQMRSKLRRALGALRKALSRLTAGEQVNEKTSDATDEDEGSRPENSKILFLEGEDGELAAEGTGGRASSSGKKLRKKRKTQKV